MTFSYYFREAQNERQRRRYQAAYKKSTLRKVKGITKFPSYNGLAIGGNFISSIKTRFFFLCQEDWEAFIAVVDRLRNHSFNWPLLFRWLIYWVFLVPPVYFFLRFLGRLTWRLPLYYFIFVESFFENFIFLHWKPARYPVVRFLYRVYHGPLLTVGWFFRCRYGLSLLGRLLPLDWTSPIFWSVILDYYIWDPINEKANQRIERFLRFWTKFFTELYLHGWRYTYYRYFHNSWFRAIARQGFRWRLLLLTPGGRRLLRLRYCVWVIQMRRRWRVIKMHWSFVYRIYRMRCKYFCIELKFFFKESYYQFTPRFVKYSILSGMFYIILGIIYFLKATLGWIFAAFKPVYGRALRGFPKRPWRK